MGVIMGNYLRSMTYNIILRLLAMLYKLDTIKVYRVPSPQANSAKEGGTYAKL
jgi:hypothetical protein